MNIAHHDSPPLQAGYTRFLRNLLLPIGDQITGQHMMRRLNFLEKAQWWEPERLCRHRDLLLDNVLNIAYNEVPYYRDLFNENGLTPEEIRKPQDLELLPVSSKDMLRSAYPDRTTRQTGQRTYAASTSGSTGKNFFVQEDAQTAGWYRASIMLALEWAGWSIGDPQMQTGMTLKRTFDRRMKDFFLRCFYVSAFDLSDQALTRNLNLLERHNIHHLWGYPGSLFLLAQQALKQGWNQPLKTIVTWGDTLYPQYRRTIEQAFKTQVYDTYGCGEGFQVSAQCGQGMNYHQHMLDVVVEYLGDDGKPVPAGQPGDVVITRLHAGPMPLIRYRVGDVASGSFERCPCGRGFNLMGDIQGRDTDIITTPSGNRLLVHFFTGTLEFFPEIDSFQIVQNETGSIELYVVTSGVISTDTQQRIISALHSRGADDLKIQIELVNNIPLSKSGKRRFVINNLVNQRAL